MRECASAKWRWQRRRGDGIQSREIGAGNESEINRKKSMQIGMG
jgi:hypothetical protein